MTRFEFNERRFVNDMRVRMTARAHEALAIYSMHKRAYDDPDYPFDRHDGQRSVRDPASQHVQSIPRGVRIVVEAEGASYEEFGNDSDGTRRFIYPKNGPFMALPLRGQLSVRGGRAVWLMDRVHTYEGRHHLENAVLEAFGIGYAIRAR